MHPHGGGVEQCNETHTLWRSALGPELEEGYISAARPSAPTATCMSARGITMYGALSLSTSGAAGGRCGWDTNGRCDALWAFATGGSVYSSRQSAPMATCMWARTTTTFTHRSGLLLPGRDRERHPRALRAGRARRAAGRQERYHPMRVVPHGLAPPRSAAGAASATTARSAAGRAHEVPGRRPVNRLVRQVHERRSARPRRLLGRGHARNRMDLPDNNPSPCTRSTTARRSSPACSATGGGARPEATTPTRATRAPAM